MKTANDTIQEAYYETIDKLQALQKDTDREAAHRDADKALTDFLAVLGYGVIVHNYLKIKKFYA